MQELKEIAVKDKVVQSVLNKIATRSIIGQQKYGTTLAENDLPLIDWLNHLQEELMDAVNYIERIKQEVKPDDHKYSRQHDDAIALTADMG